MQRDVLMTAIGLVASGGFYLLYATTDAAVWAGATLVAVAVTVALGLRASRSSAAVPARRATGVDVADELRAVYPGDLLPEMEQRLALYGIGLDWTQTGPGTALHRGLARATLAHGMRQLEEGHADEALATLDGALAELKDEPGAARTRAAIHALRAVVFERQAHVELARNEYRRALELDPDQRDAQEALARLADPA